MPTQRTKPLSGTIAASWTRRATQYASARGLDVKRLLASVGVEPESLEVQDERIAFQQHVGLLDAMARQLGDPGIGIDIGASAKPEDFGAMGLLAETSATLRDALAAIQRFNPLANQASLASHWIEAQRLFISDAHLLDGRPAPRIAAEATMTFYARTIVATTGILHPFFEVHWAHPRHRGWTDERTRLFLGVRMRFSAPKNALVAPASLLDAPLNSSKPALVPHLTTLAERLLGDMGSARDELLIIAASVRATLQRQAPLSVATTARALGCSPRTLQRRLGEANVTYRQLVDGVLCEFADELIHDDTLKLSQVAGQLGYANVRSFRRACQRWFGAPPVRVRERSRAQHTSRARSER